MSAKSAGCGLNYVELFAGCGGLSLGLDAEGFQLLFANELSPMAVETYAYNFLGTDLRDPESLRANESKVLWLKSQYPKFLIKQRLDENPASAAALRDWICDLDSVSHLSTLLSGKMLVGSIRDLNDYLEKHDFQVVVSNAVRDIDLLSGGPPCQSFSMAGLRQLTNERNTLPWEFARTADLLRPKLVLLENVSGILRAFNRDGDKHYAWFEVAKAFASMGYYPLCLHVNAKYVGAAQNRPRFIMLACREDLFLKWKSKAAIPLVDYLDQSEDLVSRARKGYGSIPYGTISCIDIERDGAVFDSGPLAHLRSICDPANLINVREAIHDLAAQGNRQSKYVKNLNEQSFNNPHSSWQIQNTEPRNNSLKVQARFRLYQLLLKLAPEDRRVIEKVIKSGDAAELSGSLLMRLSSAGWIQTLEGERLSEPSPEDLKDLLLHLKSKKQTQRALDPMMPAPAALSIPDDACHYDEGCLRTLSVREMARIQSFPDWFAFRSKVTTGGQLRKFQVPQYTQVGNAVPPLLGQALGKTCKEILEGDL